MKTKFTLFIALLCFIFSYGQDQSYDLLKNETKSKILYNRVYPVSNATNLKPQDISAPQFLQVYHEMQRADFLNRLPKLTQIQENADKGFRENYIPLSLLIIDFENIEAEVLSSDKVSLNSKNQIEIKPDAQNIFNENQLNILAPLLPKTKENQVRFKFESLLNFNLTSRKVDFVEIKDGNIWRKITVDKSFELNFPQNGKNTVFYKIHFEDGKILSQSFVIDVQYQKRAVDNKENAKLQPNAVTSISSTIPYRGYGETAAFLGKGEFEIYLDTVDGILDKPIILVDGFDPGDSRNTAAIYQLLNYGTSQNLGDLIRAQGYDVIVLNFPSYTRNSSTTIIDGGVDYIQRNAMILVELIKQINSQKIGNEKNVVIGPSMGGLISRYALRYMEQNSLNPDTRLYLSFDAPHLGANVPIGFQHLFNYMGFGPLEDVTMQGIVNGMLKSPAAREMLLDHFEGHLKSGDPVEFDPSKLLPLGAPNYRTPFQTELSTMGFPTTTRNVAISNGAGNGAKTGTPGMTILDHTFNSSSTQRAIITLNFAPLKNQTLEVSRFRGQQWIIFWFTGYESKASVKSTTLSDGLDSAPGGRFNLTNFASSITGNALLTEFMENLNIQYFNFIPAFSSLSVTGTTDYYAPINSATVTPFAAYSVPAVNEDHVSFNAQNLQFALNEILNSATLGATEEGSFQEIWIENPVTDILKIKSSSLLKDAKIIITDTAGRKFLEPRNQNIKGTVEIPVALSNGVYVVTIKSGNITTAKKIIVKK